MSGTWIAQKASFWGSGRWVSLPPMLDPFPNAFTENPVFQLIVLDGLFQLGPDVLGKLEDANKPKSKVNKVHIQL